MYTYNLASAFVSLVSTLMCFTGKSYLYGLLEVYLLQLSFVNVSNKFPVSSSYTFIQPSSFSTSLAPENVIPIFVVTSSILSLFESVLIKLSTFCASPFCVSFNTNPFVTPFVPVYAYHSTWYVSSCSSSLTPLYIFNGFSFDTTYLDVGLDVYFPIVTLEFAGYTGGFDGSTGSTGSSTTSTCLYVAVKVVDAIFDLYGFSNSSLELLYPS